MTPNAPKDLGLRLIEGRMLDATDHARALPSVVVSQATAEALWPGESAVGKRIVDLDGERWRTVVGVVSNARMRGMGQIHSELLRDIYITLDQRPTARTNIFVRTSGDVEAMTELIRQTVHAIDPTRALFDVSTMDASMAGDRRETQFTATLMMLLAGATALLTTLSIYSVMSQAAARRKHEIGVRVALGASKARVVVLMLKQAALDMSAGIALGIPLALALSSTMSNLLYGVTPTDPASFLLVAPALLAVAAASTFIPVRRALAVDPSEALRGA